MSERESESILQLMREADEQGERHKLGNGEWCIILAGVWLWSHKDWEAYRNGTLPAILVRKQQSEVSV